MKTHYFEQASREHTPTVLSLVKEYLEDNPEITDVVVATTEGSTGVAARNSVSTWEKPFPPF